MCCKELSAWFVDLDMLFKKRVFYGKKIDVTDANWKM